MGAHAAVAEHIDLSAKQILQVLPQADEIDQAATGFHLDQEINVARSIRVPSRHRAEHTDVARPVLSGLPQNLFPPVA